MTAAASAADETKPAATPWGLVVLLGAMTAMGPLAIDMYLPSLPSIGADLKASAADTQATVSSFLAGMALGQFFYGPASDRFGRKPPILLGIAVYVLASIGCTLAHSVGFLILGRFVQALGACSGGVISRAIVRDRFNHTDTARMLSLMMLIMGLAPILAPLIGGALLTVGGWRALFGVMTGFGVLVAIAAVLRLKESRSEETAIQARGEHPLRAYLSLMGQKRLLGYALAGSLNGATLFTYIASSPDLLIGAYHIPAQAFGWVFGVNAVGLIGGNQLNRLLLHRMTPDQVLARSSLIAVAVAALMALCAVTGLGGKWAILVGLFAILSTYGFIQGNTMAGALNVDPRRAGSISALMGGVSFATGALASWAAGVLHDGTPRPMALVMLVALLAAALVLKFMALRAAKSWRPDRLHGWRRPRALQARTSQPARNSRPPIGVMAPMMRGPPNARA